MDRTTLIINTGSSSLKFAVASGRQITLRGRIDRFGQRANIDLQVRNLRRSVIRVIPNLGAGLRVVKGILQEKRIRPDRIAHRIVHGGTRYRRPTELTPRDIQNLSRLSDLAPLHQAANLLGVIKCRSLWPGAATFGVFDTGAFAGLPKVSQTYALPKNITARLHIRKYGFHGISHAWAFRQAARRLHISKSSFSGVTVHLGAGDSLALWSSGRPLDTTMGFTPLEGLVMATRSGDIDPAIPLYIQKKMKWSADHVAHFLEHESGLTGLTGLRDVRDILTAAGLVIPGWRPRKFGKETKTRARFALDLFIYHIQRALSSYLGLLAHPTAVVFTGPIAENPGIQKRIISQLPALRGIRRLTVHADEEQAIADMLGA